jgi:hypothetical protein
MQQPLNLPGMYCEIVHSGFFYFVVSAVLIINGIMRISTKLVPEITVFGKKGVFDSGMCKTFYLLYCYKLDEKL